MNIASRFFLTILIGGLLLSCDECETCDVVVSPPNTSFTFVNGKQLSQITQQIADIDTALSKISIQVDTLDNQINTLTDSLNNISEDILAGVDRLEDSIAVANEIAIKNQSLEVLSDENDSTNNIRTELATIQTTILSGNVLLNSATNVANNQIVTYTDSNTVFALPLNVNENEMEYEFNIDDNQYRINLFYETGQSLNIERELSITAFGLGVNAHSFDSLSQVCSTNECISNETIFICYF